MKIYKKYDKILKIVKNFKSKNKEVKMKEKIDIGFKGYYLSRKVDTRKIESSQREIEDYKNGSLARFINPFIKEFNNLVSLDYVIKSDKLEEVDYGVMEDDLKDIKYGLITNSGILAFQYKRGKIKETKEGVFGFRNNTDFGVAVKTILKKGLGNFKMITFENLKDYYKKSKIIGKFRTCQLQDSFVKNTHLIYINPMKREFKVLPNKSHMLALQQIIEMANRSRQNGEKLERRSLEIINGLLFSGTEREGERGLGKFRDTNILVQWWDAFVLREVLERDYLGNPTRYNNTPLIKEIQALLDWYNSANDVSSIVKASILMLEISRLQPFRDGNKRTARLFSNYELIKSGYPIVAFRADSKGSFDNRLARCINSRDISDFADYLVDMIDQQQQAYLNEVTTLAHYLDDDMAHSKVHEIDGEKQ